MRWFLLLLIPAVAAQPVIEADVSTGDFVLDGQATFEVNGTLACVAHDADPEAQYTLSFDFRIASGADTNGVEAIAPEPVVFDAPCFPESADQRVHSWARTVEVREDNATAATYHIDVLIDAAATGALDPEAPEQATVHTMGRVPADAAPEPEPEPAGEESPWPIWPLLALLFFIRR